MTTRRRIVPALAAVALLCGCIHHGELPAHVELVPDDTAAEPSAPLGGEALAQRKLEMQRSQRDVVHYHATLTSLNRRRDKNGQILFRRFLEAYLGTHLDPMLRGDWQSRHPELTALDANLRFAKAELLILMRETSRAQREIEEIAQRYEGRGDMLVAYPIGGQGTLSEGLEILRNRKWWRG